MPLSGIVSISLLTNKILDWDFILFYFVRFGFILFLFGVFLIFIHFLFVLFYLFFYFIIYFILFFLYLFIYCYILCLHCFPWFLQFMCISRSLGALVFDPKIERTPHQIKRERKRQACDNNQNNMANGNEQHNRVMKDYLAPTLQGCSSSIVKPLV